MLGGGRIPEGVVREKRREWKVGVVKLHYIHVRNSFENTLLKLEGKRQYLEDSTVRSLGVCSQEG